MQLGTERVEIPVATLRGQRAQPHIPHLVFERRNTALSGAGGCNRLSGKYTVESDAITLSSVKTTGMTCASGMQIERNLLSMLAETRRWRIAGDMLELFDRQGVFLARLFAVR